MNKILNYYKDVYQVKASSLFQKNLLIAIFFFCFPATSIVQAQCSGWNALQNLDSVFTNPAFGIATSPEADKLYRPFIYLATVSGGVKVYDTNAAAMPALIATVPKTALGNLDAINLFQDSSWLYVCLGNIWNSPEMAGLAIIDVSNPSLPVVSDVYVYPGLTGGSGAVCVKGNYAYLAANQNGLVILDISDKTNIQFKSALSLNINFPHSNVGSSSMYNARGIDINGNYAFICFDRGGLRVVDISNLNTPTQINQYCYAPLINKATAYNNIIIHNNLAYVAIDYYGMEILNISNPMSITQVGWWHPSTWTDTTNNIITWSNSIGHANEIAYDSICNKVYIAAGKSDAVAIDVSNPSTLITCETYGATSDDYGTWGLDFFDGKINLAYIWSPFAPPYSNYTGLKVLQTNCSVNALDEQNRTDYTYSLYPNPANKFIQIEIPGQTLKRITIFNLHGKLLQEYFTTAFSISNLPKGIYIYTLETNKAIFTDKLIIE